MSSPAAALHEHSFLGGMSPSFSMIFSSASETTEGSQLPFGRPPTTSCSSSPGAAAVPLPAGDVAVEGEGAAADAVAVGAPDALPAAVVATIAVADAFAAAALVAAAAVLMAPASVEVSIAVLFVLAVLGRKVCEVVVATVLGELEVRGADEIASSGWREEEEERKEGEETAFITPAPRFVQRTDHAHDFRHASIAEAALSPVVAKTAAGRLASRAKWEVYHYKDLKIKDMVGPAVVSARQACSQTDTDKTQYSRRQSSLRHAASVS